MEGIMTPSKLTLEAWPVTEAGQAEENEDFVLVYHPADEQTLRFSGSLYVVADGLGGGERGQIASRYAAQKIMHSYFTSDEPDLGYRLRQAIQAANADLYSYVQDRPELVKMGTTIVAAAVRGEQLHVASVGDSRAYVVRDGAIQQITRDHTLVQQLLDEDAITPDEALEHPRRDVVLRTVGGGAEIDIDVFDLRLHPDDVLLLCSDGLTSVLHDDEIAQITATASPRNAAETLVQKATDRAGKDNVTVIAALVRDGGPPLVSEVPHTWDGEQPSFDAQPTLAVPRVEREETEPTSPAAPPVGAPSEPVPAPPYQESVQPAPAFGQPAAQPAPTTQTPRPARPVQPQGEVPIDPVTGLPPVPQQQQPGYAPQQGVPAGYQPRVYQPPTGPNMAPPPRRGVSLGAFLAVGVLAILLTILMVLILVNPWGWQLPFTGGGEQAAEVTPPAEGEVPTGGGEEAAAPTEEVQEQPPVVAEVPTQPTPTPQVVAPPNMVLIGGGAYQRGATDEEIQDATLSCIQEREDGQCFSEWFTDAQPVEEITLSPFFLDVTEVTNLAYAECVNAGVCSAPDNTEFYDDPAFAQHPVVYVNYDQATQYCGWAGKRLPTEAEWEKAARYDPATGDESRYPWGNSFEVGIANTASAGQGGLTAVQAFPGDLSPNGVLGMAGNASEWVQDWYFGDYSGLGALNPVRTGAQPLPDPFRVGRGGSFTSIAAFARAAHRLDVPPQTTEPWLGFRCAQSVGGETVEEPVESPVEPAATEEGAVEPTGDTTPDVTDTPQP